MRKLKRNQRDETPAKSDEVELYFERMEPKILFSADALSGIAVVDPNDENDGKHQGLDVGQSAEYLTEAYKPSANDSENPSSEPDIQSLALEALQVLLDGQDPDTDDTIGTFLRDTVEPTHERQEIIFVDAATPDYKQLLSAVKTDTPDTDYQIFVLQSDRDGIEQISQVLGSQHGVDAIHLISHGNETGIQLGSSWLDQDSLAASSDLISGWSSVFKEDADILIYGCNLAAEESGLQLIEELSELSGADVAASTDLTGDADLGGDWDLEHHVGEVETDVAFTPAIKIAWKGVLLNTGTAIWADDTSNPKEVTTDDWDGSDFSGTPDSAAVADHYSIMQGAEAPTRDEKIVVGIQANKDVGGIIWDGTNWSAIPTTAISGNVSHDFWWGADVAYEEQSGDAMVVYNDGTNLRYSVWDGTSWTTESAQITAFTGSDPEHMHLVTKPGDDEMILVVSDRLDDDYVMVWDGSSWGNALLLDTTGNKADDKTAINAIYEETSGHAMVVFGVDGDTGVNYRIWDGSSWDAGPTNVPIAGGGATDQAKWITLDSDPTSDRLVMGVITVKDDAWASVWDGSSWNNSITVSTALTGNDHPAADVAFESHSGQAMIVFSEGSTVQYMTWDDTGGWSTATNTATFTTNTNTLVLDSAPSNNEIMLSVQDDDKDISFVHWNGTTWGTVDELGLESGQTKSQPFLYLWDYDNVPPTATNLTSTSAYNEGEPFVPLTDIVVSDADVGDTITARLTLTNTAAGSLTSGIFGSATSTYTPATGIWTVTGSVTDVNAALAAVAFVPNTNNDVDTTITTHIEDAYGAGPADGTITLDVTPANDPPTATNMSSTSVYNEGDAFVPLTNIIVTDVDTNDTITATLTLANVAAGTLTTGTFGSSTSTYIPAAGLWTVTGTVTDVNAALASVTFIPAVSNDVDTTIKTHIEDATGFGPADGTITLDVIPGNAVPTATNLTSTSFYTEGDSSVAITDIVVSDADVGETITAVLTLANTLTGSLSANDGASYDGVTGIWTITGTVAQVNTALANLVFNPTTNNDADVKIVTHIEDAAGDGPTDGIITLDVTPVNDAPTVTNLSGDTLLYTVGDGPQVIDQGGDALVSDIDSIDFDGGNLTVSIMPTDWWNDAWNSRSKITFDASSSGENLSGFPVLIKLTAADIDFAKIKTNGADIRFVDSDGTALDYEIDTWDDVGETASVWVKVQTVDAASSTDFIHIYYDNSLAVDAQNGTAVWGTDHIGVWHLGELVTDEQTVGTHTDSAGTLDGAQNSNATGSGQIGGAQDFDGSNDFISFASTDFGDSFTIETWIKPASGLVGNATIVANSIGGGSADGFRFLITDTGLIRFDTGNGIDHEGAESSVAINFDQWNHVAVTVDKINGLATIFHNGTDVTTDATIRADFNTNSDWVAGIMEDNSRDFNGEIDELRVASVMRSADWIATSHKTQNNSFNTIGTEENLHLDEDLLSIRNEGSAPGQIGVTGSNVTYGGVLIGTVSGGLSSDLVIKFNTNATEAAVSALVNSITYKNIDPVDPIDGDRTVGFTVTDGDGAASSTHNATVSVTAANNAPSFATPGAGDGIVTWDSGIGKDVGESVVIQSDGKFLVAGKSDNGSDMDFLLLRYNIDGSLDPTFGGGDGIVITDFGGVDQGWAVTLQADGKILVVGDSDSDVAVARYNSDGSLDTSFGTNGMVTTDLFTAADGGRGVIVQADGKILVSGQAVNSPDGANFAVIRYNADGSLDTGFGTNGIVDTDFNGLGDFGKNIKLQSDGKIVVGGTATYATEEFAVARYNTDGSLDLSFGGTGFVHAGVTAGNDPGLGIALQDDDKIVQIGYSESSGDIVVMRWNSDGTLDTSFDGDGIVTTDFGAFSAQALDEAVAIQPDGKIVVGGYIDFNEFTVVRYNSDGSLDTSFGGGDGDQHVAVSAGDDRIRSLALRDDGKIILVGFGTNTGKDVAIAVLDSDGNLDTDFDAPSTLDGNPSFVEGGPAVVLDSDVDVQDVDLDSLNGGNGNYSGADLTLIRNGGANPEDVFSFNDGNGITFSGGNLIKNSQIIASFDTTTTPGALIITFTDANGEIPTSADTDNILRQIAYSNSSDNPAASTQIDWIFNDGQSGETAGSKTISITAVNDVPTATNLSSSAAYNEGDTTVAITDIVVSDADIGDTITAMLTLANTAAGSLSANDGATYNSLSGVWSISGTVTQVNTALANLVFNPATNNDVNTTITTHIEDTAGSGPADGVINLNVTAVNDNPSFTVAGGGDGIITWDGGAGDDVGDSIVLLDDGKYLIAGRTHNGTDLDFFLHRYNADGTLDVTFGDDGIVITDFGGIEEGFAATVQADGKILFVGRTNNDFALARYLDDGSLDTSFGTGGLVTTDLFGGSDQARGVTVQADGKILVSGTTDNPPNAYDLALVRYNSDGSLDTGFGTNGIVATDFAGGDDEGKNVIVQADGKILVSGYASVPTKEFAVVRYNSDGSLDTSFGGTGSVHAGVSAGDDPGFSIALQDDGKIVQAGFSNDLGDLVVMRWNSDGTLDTSFGGSGQVTTDFSPLSSGAHDEAVTIQPDGKILVGGFLGPDIMVIRFNTDGSIDTSFGGGDGLFDLDFSGAIDRVRTLEVQEDGRIIVTGFATNTDKDLAVIVLENDGTLSTDFDAPTTLDGNPAFVEDTAAVILDADVDIRDVELDSLNGGNGNYNGADITLVRNAGANAEDQFSFNDANGITLVAGNLVKNSQIIATFDTTTTPGKLTVSFTDANGEIPTSADIDNILRQITYANSSDTPPSSAQIDWIFNDGQSGQTTGSTTVTITAVNDLPTALNSSVSTDEDLPYVFAASDFNFADLEGDALAQIRVTSLESSGSLQLNGFDVVLNQVISRADIDAGLLTFASPLNEYGANYDSFGFQVHDGTEYSAASYTMRIDVDPVNDVPVANAGTDELANEGDTQGLDAGGSTDVEGTAMEQITTDGGEQQLNTATTGDQKEVDIAIAADGSYVAVWEGVDADKKGVFAQRFNADGTLDGAEVQVNTATADDQKKPSIAMADDGSYIVAWEGRDADKKGIFAQRFAADGSAIGGEFQVNTATGDDQKTVDVAMSNDGRFVIVWEGVDTDLKGVFGQLYDASGNPVGGEFQVSTTEAGDQKEPAVGMASDGSFVVTWESADDGDKKGVFAQRFDSNGDVLGREFRVNTTIAEDQKHADIAVGDDGGFLITWTSGPGGAKDIFAQRFDNGGGREGGEFQVNTVTAGDQNKSRVAMMDDGSAIIFWESPDASDKGIVGQRFDADNNAIGAEFQINTTTLWDQKHVAAAINDDGEIVVAWEGWGAVDKEVYAQRYDSVNDLSYTWTQISGPAVTISDIHSARPSFEVPEGLTGAPPTIEFEVEVSDGEHSSKDTVIITINRSPTSANNTLVINEDTIHTFSALDFAFSDIDPGHVFSGVQISTLEAAGSLQLSGVDVTLEQVISKADIDAGNLKFVPDLHANGIGYGDFGFRVSDGHMLSLDEYTMSIDVTAVQDAPIATNNTVTIDEDTDHVFSVADFNYTDFDGEAMAQVRITSLETAGSLKLDGVDVVLNQVVSRADIDAGKLIFSPVADENGTGYDSFTFQVHDGIEYSVASYSMTVDVTPVNDPPTATNLSSTSAYNEGDANVAITDIVVSDADPGDTITATLTLANTATGTLSANDGASYNGLTGIWTITGTVAQVNTALANLVFNPTTNNDVNTIITTHIEDADGAGPADGTINLNVTAANDAPLATNLSSTSAYNEGDASVAITDIVVSDVDTGETITATLTLADTATGTLSANNGATYNGLTGIWTITGTVAQVNTALANLVFNPETNNDANTTITTHIEDAAGTGPADGLITLNVTSVNDTPSFTVAGGGDGVLSWNGGSTDEAVTVAFQDDGKILVAGNYYNGSNYDFLLQRYNADGTLDTSFGNGDGIVITDFANNEYVGSLVIQADGKILVVGDTDSSDSDLAVARYNTDGSLDTGFGTGGLVTTDLFTGTDWGWGVALQADGKFLISGQTDNAPNGIDFSVVRYNADGSLDTGFGTNGVVATDFSGGNDTGQNVVVQPDGKILVGGIGTFGTQEFTVVRYNTDGSLDVSFGGGTGYAHANMFAGTDKHGGIALQDDGKIVQVGSSNDGGPVVARWNSDGTLDTTFDIDGKVQTNVGAVTSGVMQHAVTIQHDGKILVAGYSDDGTDSAMLVLRYNTDGSLDSAFGGGNGYVQLDLSGNDDVALSLAVRADGKIAVVGYTANTNWDAAIVMLNNDGSLDTDFDAPTTLDGSPTFVEDAPAVVLDADVNIRDVELDSLNGGSGNYSGADLTLVRNGSASTEDVFSFNDGNGITLVGGNLIKNSQIIASFDTTTTPGELTIVFTDANGEIPTSADTDNILRQITYANNADNPPSSAQINWIFDDGQSGETVGSTTVTITPSNDAPTATNLSSTSAYNEGDASVAITDIVVSDVDTGDTITATLTLADTAAGTLSANDGASYNGLTGVWSITGTVAQVNTALANLVFNPATNNDVNTTITTHIEDTAGAGPADGTINLNVTPANDVPTATNLSSTSAYNEGDTNVAITDIVVSDIDTGDTITATLTLADTAAGTLSANNGATYNGLTGVWSITGTVAQVNTALANLVFNPATNNDVNTTITTHIEDAAGAGPADGVINLNVTPANDAPTATNLSSTSAYTEGDTNVPITDIVVSDVDTGDTITATLTLADTAAGTLSANDGATYNGLTGIWSITGTVAQVNTALANLVFNPATDNDLNTTITTHIEDAAGAGPADGTINLNVTPANDAPTAINLSSTSAYNEGDTNVAITDIVVSDIDTGETITATLTLTDTATGTLSANDGATYNGLTGIWSITGTVAQVNTALANLVFNPATDNDVNTTITTHIEDAAGAGPADGTINLNVTPANDAPTATNLSSTSAYTEGDTSVPITDIVVSDVDTGDTITATLTLANIATGTLSANDGATYNGLTGVWSITGTVAQVNTALANLVFNPATNNEVDTTITTHIEDATGAGPTDGLINLNVTPVNDAPTATNLSSTSAYNEGDASVAITDIVVSDIDIGDTITATLTLTDTSTGSLTTGSFGSAASTYDSVTGIWLVSGSATDVNAALAAVAFIPNTNNDVNTTITTHIEDAAGAGPADGTINLNVTPANDAPTATNLSSTSAYTEGDTNVPITDIVVSDVDTSDTITATLTLADTAAGTLSANDGASYNGLTGVWSITGTVAQVNTALANLVFNPATNNDVNTTITTHIEDTAGAGPVDGTINLNVTPANDAPTATNLSSTSAYNEGDTNVAITDIVVSDVDTGDTITATLTLADTAAGTLSANDGATYNGLTGIWSITGTVAQVNTALANLVFNPATNNDVNTTITTHIEDAAGAGPTDGIINLNVTPANDAPTATNLSSTSAYNEGDTNVAITDIVVSDVDTGDTITATLTLADTAAGTLSANDGATYNGLTGIWSITGTVAQVNTALANLVFNPATDNDLNTTITTHIEDAAGAGPADGTINLNVTPANDAPTATNLSSIAPYNEGDTIVPITDIVVSDVDTGETITATLTLANTATGALSANDGATYNGLTGVWSITDTVAQVNTALANLVFNPMVTNDLDTSINVNIVDAAGTGPADGTIMLDVVETNNPPVATNLFSTSAYNEGDASVSITNIVVSDVDTGDIVTATLTLANTATGSLSANDGASYNSLTGVWTITGSVAQVNTALANLVFNPTANNDLNTSISVNIDDGDEDLSGALTGSINLNVTPANDAPTATNLNSTSVYNEGDASVAITDIVVSDVDTGETVTATLTLADTSTGSLSANNGATYNGLTGIWTITGSVSQVNTALANLVFTPTSENELNTSISVSIDDGDEDGSGALSGTIALNVNPVNDAPLASGLSSTSTYDEGDTSVALNDIVISDIDGGETLTATLVLANTSTGSLSANDGAAYNAGTGIWTITGTVAQVNTALANLEFIPVAGNVLNTAIAVSIDDGDEDSSGPLVGALTLKVNPAPEPPAPPPPPVEDSEPEEPEVEEPVEEAVEETVEEAPEETLEAALIETAVSEILDVIDPSSNATGDLPVPERAESSDELAPGTDSDPREPRDRTADKDEKEVQVKKIEASKPVGIQVLIQKLQDQIEFFDDPLQLVKAESFVTRLDDMRDELVEETEDTEKVIGSSLSVTAGLSVGYVVWLARSGILLSSVLSSMPAWRFIDPLPVLGALQGRNEGEDDESLESLVQQETDEESDVTDWKRVSAND